jgi:release factor glutamine methyltransferase
LTAPVTIAGALDGARRILAAAGVPNPRLEARLLVSHALGVGMETVMGHPERPVPYGRKDDLDAVVNRRARREPMAYLLGFHEFWSLPFRVTPHTLVPRPETETLVEAALDWLGKRRTNLRILDLGTGSGCLLLALLSELTKAWGVGVDASFGALQVARQNAADLGLVGRAGFARSDWARAVAGPFDIVVSNPPYIADPDFAALAPEVVQFEPRSALSGGPVGLAAYGAMVPQLGRLLAPGGAAFLEIGAGAAADVTQLLRSHGFQDVEIKDDLAGIPRCARVVATI